MDTTYVQDKHDVWWPNVIPHEQRKAERKRNPSKHSCYTLHVFGNIQSIVHITMHLFPKLKFTYVISKYYSRRHQVRPDYCLGLCLLTLPTQLQYLFYCEKCQNSDVPLFVQLDSKDTFAISSTEYKYIAENRVASLFSIVSVDWNRWQYLALGFNGPNSFKDHASGPWNCLFCDQVSSLTLSQCRQIRKVRIALTTALTFLLDRWGCLWSKGGLREQGWPREKRKPEEWGEHDKGCATDK